jgi:protein BCP1
MPKKKQRTEQNDNDDDNSSTNSNEMEFNEQITIDFEARSPQDFDFDSIKLLLNQKLGQFSLNLGEIAEIIIQQNHIGNVIYQAVDEEEPICDPTASSSNDDDTIFGVISLLNLRKYKQKDSIQQFTSLLNKELKKLKKLDSKSKEFLDRNIFETLKIGYLVNERYINIPSEISVPMYESLFKDLDDENDDSPCNTATSSSASSNSEFDYIMVLSKSFEPDSGSNRERDYANNEEEVLKEFCDYIFELKYPKLKDSQFNFFLEVLFLSRAKLSEALTKIKSLVK